MQKILENHQRKAGFQNHGENYAIESYKIFQIKFCAEIHAKNQENGHLYTRVGAQNLQ